MPVLEETIATTGVITVVRVSAVLELRCHTCQRVFAAIAVAGIADPHDPRTRAH